MNKKEWSRIKEALRNSVNTLIKGAINLRNDFEPFPETIGKSMADMVHSVHQTTEVLKDVISLQIKAVRTLHDRYPETFWAVLILYFLVALGIVISQLLPGLIPRIILNLWVIPAGFLTLLAPMVLVYLIRHGTFLVFLLAFIAAVIAPITFFGGLYIWLGLPSSGEAFYFSVTTFVTVGFGDSPLINAGHKVIAALEGFIGYLYLGVFIAAIPKVIDNKSELQEKS